MESKDLRDYAIENISVILHTVFPELKMTNKLRNEIASEMAIIAANSFRIGYYAYAKKEGIEAITEDNFNNQRKETIEVEELLEDLTWRIRQSKIL